jgi:electron transfer flavoprotein-quinone oxidoreductase
MLVAGDAGGFCLAAGLFLEGVNFAIGSGRAAAETAIAAVARGDTTKSGLGDYRRKINDTFVMADHKKMRRAPELVLSDRMQTQYAGLICDMAEGLFTVSNPTPKPGLRAIFRQERKRHGVRLRSVVRDGITSLRTFG